MSGKCLGPRFVQKCMECNEDCNVSVFWKGFGSKCSLSLGLRFPNLATVVLAMDFTDEVLATNMVSNNYCQAIQATLGLRKQTLNCYYSKTNSSETYCIAIGEYLLYSNILVSTEWLDDAVLHPWHKLAYFRSTGWLEDWIRTAEVIMHETYERKYKNTEPEEVCLKFADLSNSLTSLSNM